MSPIIIGSKVKDPKDRRFVTQARGRPGPACTATQHTPRDGPMSSARCKAVRVRHATRDTCILSYDGFTTSTTPAADPFFIAVRFTALRPGLFESFYAPYAFKPTLEPLGFLLTFALLVHVDDLWTFRGMGVGWGHPFISALCAPHLVHFTWPARALRWALVRSGERTRHASDLGLGEASSTSSTSLALPKPISL